MAVLEYMGESGGRKDHGKWGIGEALTLKEMQTCGWPNNVPQAQLW